MIVTGTWQEVSLTGNGSTTIQNKDYNYCLVHVGATAPTAEDVGFKLTPSGTENSVIKFDETLGKMFIRCDVGTCTIEVQGETTLGEVLTAPTIEPIAGAYVGSKTITITDTSGESADIYYTTNGIDPSKGNGTLYTEPFDIGGDYNAGEYMVKAVAVKKGFFKSSITKIAYTILLSTFIVGGGIWVDEVDWVDNNIWYDEV